MLKQAAKWMVSKTPWRIVRADRLMDSFVEGEAVKHNTMDGWDTKFDDSKVVNAYYSSARQRLNKEIVATITRARSVAAGDIVGDVGCGLGHFLQMAGETFQGARLYGYDFSKSGLQAAGQRCPQGTFEFHDMYQPLPRRHHVTICSQTLEHLLDPTAAARNLIDGTFEAGIAVFTVPDGRLDTYKGHINFWSPESWEHWVKGVANGRKLSCHRMAGGTAGGANLLAVINC